MGEKIDEIIICCAHVHQTTEPWSCPSCRRFRGNTYFSLNWLTHVIPAERATTSHRIQSLSRRNDSNESYRMLECLVGMSWPLALTHSVESLQWPVAYSECLVEICFGMNYIGMKGLLVRQECAKKLGPMKAALNMRLSMSAGRGQAL